MRAFVFAPGNIIAGHYRLIRLLGGGGMGVVWSAKNEAISRDVAIKVMHPHIADDPVSLQRFFNEARICGSIRNPGIVDVLDLGCAEDGSPFIVMELLEGESLEGKLQREGRLLPSVILPIVRDIARTITLAHDKDVVHRDIKPGNIFLQRGSPGQTHVKVLDFGISKVLTPGNNMNATRTGSVIGSPLYMSPEQALGRLAIDRRTDIYALGVILYEALAGKTPFEAENYNALIVSIVTMQPPDITTHLPGLLPEIADIVRGAMARDREQRIATMVDLADRIERVLPYVKDADLKLQRELDEPTQIPDMRGSLPSAGDGGAGSQTASMLTTVFVPPRRARWPFVSAGLFVIAGVVGLLLMLRGPSPARPTSETAALQASPVPSAPASAALFAAPSAAPVDEPAPSVIPGALATTSSSLPAASAAPPGSSQPWPRKPFPSSGPPKKTPNGAWSYD